ncbi:MAG: hypothetical protein WBF53_16210 [Litorimonas sp.]
MQLGFHIEGPGEPPGGGSQRMVVADYLLRRAIPIPTVVYRLNPPTQFVKGVIGGKTRSEASARALSKLWARFGSWEAVAEGPPRDILEAVSDVTHPELKADRLRRSLRQLCEERGRVDLSPVDRLSVPQALLWLERLPGVGRKASASVLNHSTLHRRALVIDSHHLRIAQRLGWVGPTCTGHDAYDRLMPRVPDGWDATRIDDHHRRFKRLGQDICRPTRPKCGICPLQSICATGQGD